VSKASLVADILADCRVAERSLARPAYAAYAAGEAGGWLLDFGWVKEEDEGKDEGEEGKEGGKSKEEGRRDGR
jgi:hypothetical protein